MPSGRCVGFGVLGCADIALRRMLPAIVRSPGAELVAVASRDPATARSTAQRFGARSYAGHRGYEAVLAHPDVDAVYLPVPAALHAEWTERALLAGKHVLVEKPLATSPADTAELARLARRAGLTLRENILFLHHAQHRKVQQLVREGAIGQLRALSASFAVPRRPPADIRLRPELGGGALWDVGVYPLRAALLLLGADLRVAGATLAHDPRYGVDIGGGALLRRRDGVTAQLTFGIDHMYDSGYRLTGTTGRLTLTNAFTPPADHRPVIRITTQDGRHELPLVPDDQCANTVAAFVDAVAEGRHGVDRHTLAQARLLDRIRRHALDPLPGVPDRQPADRHHPAPPLRKDAP